MADVWRRLQEKMPEFTVEEMKKKKEALFSVYQNLRIADFWYNRAYDEVKF